MSTWIWGAAALAVVLFLCRNLLRRFTTDDIQALLEKRRAGALVVSRGDFIDGDQRIDVAMALTKSTLFYESKYMEASLDLQWVSEIEYGTRVRTGANITDGEVLLLRCYSRSFEFIVPTADVAQWRTMLPARRGDPAAAETLPTVAAVAAV